MHILAALTDAPAKAASRRRRGRPQVEQDPQERDRHIACACRRLMRRESIQQVAEQFGVSCRTVQLWTNRALTYDHPVSRVLAALVAQSN